MTPRYKFYDVTVSIETEDSKGKMKKSTLKYLVDAADTTAAEKNAYKLLEGTMGDWEIIGINLSKTKEVFIDEN